MRNLLPIALVALALVAPPAASQGQGMVMVTIVDLPPGPATVSAGQTHSVSFSVNLMASGFQCAQPATLSVDLLISNANAAPAGVAPTVDPVNVTFTIAPGVYGLPSQLPVGQPFNQTAGATLRIATTTASAGSFPASVSASFAGANVQGCVPAFPAAQDTKTHTLQIQGSGSTNTTGPGPIGPGNNITQPEQPPAPAPSRGLPGFEPLLALGALAAAMAFRARRRD